MRPTDSAPSRPRAKAPALRLGMPVSLIGIGPSANDSVIRLLARDRLRELRDDGVTIDYIGRMYDVSGERMLEIEQELKR